VARKCIEGCKLLNRGQEVAEFCWQLEITESNGSRQPNQHGSKMIHDAKGLKVFDKENARLT